MLTGIKDLDKLIFISRSQMYWATDHSRLVEFSNFIFEIYNGLLIHNSYLPFPAPNNLIKYARSLPTDTSSPITDDIPYNVL